jgi:YebC/PmpR family DNA-binding regulatory protein
MSGHSKWHNIKLKKGKVDAKRGASFTKISKEIILAAKNGSPDPEANYRLKMAVDKARVANMPQENIKRAIARGNGGADEKLIEEIRYEGYGPANIAVIIEAATDNRNRTASEIRFLFSRNNGVIGEPGSVGWIFESRGLIEVDPQKYTEDELTERALVEGVIDVRFGEPTEIITEPTHVMAAKDELEAAGLRVTSAQLSMEAKQTVRPSAGDTHKVLAFLDALEEHEDVHRVYSNADFDEAALEALLS